MAPFPRGALREPLSLAMGSRAKVGTLRVLSLIHEPITQRDVARRAGFQHRSVQLAIEDLVAVNLVMRIEGGRDFLVALNRGHRLASSLQSLFVQEAEHFLEVRRAIAEALGATGVRDLCAVLFGSVARAEDRAESDLDLLIVVPAQGARERVLEALESLRAGLLLRFGVELRPIGYTYTEARRLWKQRRSPIREALRDGIALVGPPLREALDGTG